MSEEHTNDRYAPKRRKQKVKKGTKTTDKLFLFYKCWPSQYSAHSFVIDEEEYVSVEQYVMAEKAKLFNDMEARESIMATKRPDCANSIGRKIYRYDEETWARHREDIVYEGNYAKFTQNEEVYQSLMETDGLLLAQANPYDTVFGIGLGLHDPNSTNSKKWRGQNILGNILTDIREELKRIAMEENEENNAEYVQKNVAPECPDWYQMYSPEEKKIFKDFLAGIETMDQKLTLAMQNEFDCTPEDAIKFLSWWFFQKRKKEQFPCPEWFENSDQNDKEDIFEFMKDEYEMSEQLPYSFKNEFEIEFQESKLFFQWWFQGGGIEEFGAADQHQALAKYY